MHRLSKNISASHADGVHAALCTWAPKERPAFTRWVADVRQEDASVILLRVPGYAGLANAADALRVRVEPPSELAAKRTVVWSAHV